MKKSSNSVISAASAYKCHCAIAQRHFVIALLTLINFAPLASAYPGNRERYDCYRKSDNQFSFGSPTNVSNRTILCTTNPNYRSSGSGTSRQRGTSTRSNTRRTSRKVYKNNYRNRDNTGEKIAIGLGSFAVGALIGSAFWGWGGWGWGGWGGWGGDIFIDDSINVIGDIGDVDIGDIGDLDASIQDLDLTEIDASGDDFGGDDFGGDDFGDMNDAGGDDFGDMNDAGGDDFGDMNDAGGDDFGGMDDFGGDDFGGDDFGGDDFGGDDFGGDDFGGDDF